MKSDTNPGIIFILGIKMRSGTNFLSDLLCQHPHCFPNTIKEDYSLLYARHLIDYADAFYSRMPMIFKVQASPKTLLYRSLGLGLLNYFNDNMINTSKPYKSSRVAGRPARIVTKTPSVENLAFFESLFPEMPLLIVVRDGRDVVESNVKSFETDYEAEMNEWAAAAQTILNFTARMKDSDQPYMLIKYEDLFLNTKDAIAEILKFLDLELSQYDFSMVDDLPVRGSSELRDEGRLHWKPVEKTSDFNPIGRWHGWSPDLIDRFEGVAGNHLRALGY